MTAILLWRRDFNVGRSLGILLGENWVLELEICLFHERTLA